VYNPSGFNQLPLINYEVRRSVKRQGRGIGNSGPLERRRTDTT
jgi:hypothetical protein